MKLYKSPGCVYRLSFIKEFMSERGCFFLSFSSPQGGRSADVLQHLYYFSLQLSEVWSAIVLIWNYYWPESTTGILILWYLASLWTNLWVSILLSEKLEHLDVNSYASSQETLTVVGTCKQSLIWTTQHEAWNGLPDLMQKNIFRSRVATVRIQWG